MLNGFKCQVKSTICINDKTTSRKNISFIGEK